MAKFFKWTDKLLPKQMLPWQGGEKSATGLIYQGKWSEEERTLHIKMLELLEIEFGLFFYTRRKRVTAINFQIDNKEALPYFLKMGGREGCKEQI